MNLRSPILLGALVVISASSQAVLTQAMHLPTSRDAFLKVQYKTAGELVAALKKKPKVLSAMAKVFHTSSKEVLDYLATEVTLSELKESGKYKVWGLTPSGRLYASTHTFAKGMKVWAAADGTPILRFVCSNPMTESLPKVTPPPAPEPPAPAPAPTPAPVEPPAPAPMPAPVEPPAPAPVPAPTEPTPAPTPPTPPQVEPVPAPAPIPVVSVVEKTYPFRVWLSGIRWTSEQFNENETVTGLRTDILGAGASLDLRRNGDYVRSLFIDTSGYFTNKADKRPLRFAALGIQSRRDFGNASPLFQPYFGAGLGVYRVEVLESINRRYTTLGGRAFFGVETRSRFFVEAVYNYLGHKREGRTIDRVSLALGYRF